MTKDDLYAGNWVSNDFVSNIMGKTKKLLKPINLEMKRTNRQTETTQKHFFLLGTELNIERIREFCEEQKSAIQLYIKARIDYSSEVEMAVNETFSLFAYRVREFDTKQKALCILFLIARNRAHDIQRKNCLAKDILFT